MTAKHRYRILFAVSIVVVGLGLATGPIFVQDGLWAGLGVFALSALPAAALLGIIAYIWHGNDKERAQQTGEPRPLHRP